MLKIEWENFRRADNSIDLVAACNSLHTNKINEVGHAIVITQLAVLENLARIHSRQVAALAITQAIWAASTAVADSEYADELDRRLKVVESYAESSPTVGTQSTR
ncbi:hypothetical protein KC963_00580 [Candidatus Saccharibacteria bacterium]|nr:hypothetical protein [Candidatus Saccharibacteria bacterium]